MFTPRAPMVPGSTPFTVCVSIASVSAFLALVAIILILVWLYLRQLSVREREDELEAQIADLQRRLRAAQNQDSEEWKSSRSHHRFAERIPQRRDDEGKMVREELAFTQGELSKAWESNSKLEGKVERLGRDLEAERRKVDQLDRQIDKLKAENAKLKVQDGGGKKRFTETKHTESGMRNGPELQRTDRALQGKAEVPRNETVSTRLDDEPKGYQDLIARNQYLQDELKAARKYGSMEDQYAGAEVLDKVEKLNSEILQVAATVAEGLDLDKWAHDRSPSSVDNSIVKNLETIIGRELTRSLRLSESQDLNILLQTAFQASMTYHTSLVTSSWCYGSLQEERLFNETYRSMRNLELQAVSGRWRQLARAHLKESKSAYEQYLMPNLATTLAEIIVAAGSKQDAAIVRKQITDRFASRLGEVIKAAQDLHHVIGEGITSCDFEVVWLQPGTPFDTGLMEDTFGPTTGNDREEVACVTDIGLMSKERESGSSQRKQSVLLKAKVLLPSGLTGIRLRDDT